MPERFSKEERSAVMRKVRSKGNRSTEGRLIAIFQAAGIKGWRRNYPVIGKPDFVFLKARVAVFADGCFWHGHPCRNITPKQNADYWVRKRQRNMARDKEVTVRLEARGWTVIRLWECEIKNGAAENRLRASFKDTGSPPDPLASCV